MADHKLMAAAGQIADGVDVDWVSISSSLVTEEEREIADELALVSKIARGHRELHQLLPVAPDTPPQLMPDRTRWGHLDLLNIVGKGSYGTVYRAWDTRLERLVALKLFHGVHDPDHVMREGRMLARVRHENVVTVYGADIIDGIAGLWMELVHGRTLDEMLRADGPMDARQAAAIGADVARALTAVHNAGLLHCDIKAQNVVREGTGRVVLMDLGAGRPVPEHQDDAHLSDVAGTPRYMAPELFRAGAKPTRATDAYSFGVLLYYLASTKYPVDGKSLGELKQAHLDGLVRPLAEAKDGLPAGYLALVSRLLDPEATKRTSSAAEIQSALTDLATPPATPSLPRSIGLLAAVAIGVGVLVTAVVRPSLTPAAPPAPEIRSIAVLPIKNLTGDPAKQYIADGLTELLISNLARSSAFRVPSFAAIAGLGGSGESPAETAKKLGVKLILAGSIAEANGQVRLSVHLTDEQGTAIWGDEVTRDAAAAMSAQADVARRLAERLAVSVGSTASRQPQMIDPRAQDAYLRGLALRVSSPNSQEAAAQAFREAVTIEPGLSDAWGQLALIEVAMGDRMPSQGRNQSRVVAMQMAERAIKLDPDSSTGYAALGTIQFYFDWDFPAAEQTLRRAAAPPSAAFARQRLSMLLAALGRHGEAIPIGEESQRIEPTVALRSTSLGTLYYYARDYDKAAAEMRRALSVTPDFSVAHFGLGRINSALGRHDEAIAEIERAVSISKNATWLTELARAFAAAGRHDDAERVLREVEDRETQGDHATPDNYAYIAAAEGHFDEAFRILEEASNDHIAAMLWIAVDPRADPLRNDPRFDRLLAKMKLRP